jgi:F0F1-type ATP synthase epsilon subunit
LSTSRESNTTTSTENATEADDLDPAAFLESIRLLSEKREREDNERYRKLESEIEKGRQERLARRAGE